MGNRKTLGRALAALVLSALVAAVLVTMRSTATAAIPGDPLCVAKPASVASGATKIMIAGDSITSASAGDYTWRYFLWKHLVNPNGVASPAPAAYDFVGPYSNLVQPVSPYARTSDDYNCDFDKQNAAIPGASITNYTAAQTLTGNPLVQATVIRNLTKDNGANVLVAFVGAQDLSKTGADTATADQVLARTQTMVVEAQKANAAIKVVLVTAPEDGSVAKVGEYNTKLKAQAPGWSTASSKVAVATTATGWATAALTYDRIHPNPQGEVTIAADVADALEKVGVGTAAARPLPNYAAYVGPHAPAVLAQPTINGGTANLSWTLPPGSTVSAVQRNDYTAGTGWTTFTPVIDVKAGASGPPYVSTFADTTYTPGHVYQYRIISAKGTTIWTSIGTNNPAFIAPPYVQYSTSITSNVVTVPSGATLPPTGTPTTPTATPTTPPTTTPTTTPTVTTTPTPTVTVTPTPTPTTTTTANPGKAGAVSSFSATPTVHGMALRWGTAPGAVSYYFTWQAAGDPNTYGKMVAANVHAYNISGLAAGRTYGFRVQAFGSDGEGGPLFVKLNRAPLPYALAKPSPRTTATTTHKIKVAWAAVAHASKYQVQRRPVGGSWKTYFSSTARSYKTGKLVKGKAYEFRVRAFDGAAAGPWSATVKRKAK
ncbi:lysophospholipase L1-like esterase [Marmoricola sp. OAE513]|uniref:fibronectin type III domain-containing protein n=1 Tax=Marmoricola sp. OAE513 TaxID=2817894 RepID=UPI001AE11AFF